MRKLSFYAALCVVLFGLGYAGYLAKAAPGVIKIRPYSSVVKMTDVKTGHVSSIVRTSIREDGSRVETSDEPITVIWDISRRTETRIDPVTRSYVVAPLVARRIPKLLYREADCEKAFSRGRPNIIVVCESTGEQKFNHDVTKITERRSFPDGTSLTQIEYAIQDLGWLIVRRESYDNTGTLTVLVELVDLKEGNPPSADFSPPADFQRMDNFVDYLHRTKGSRGEEPTQKEIEGMAKKWNTVVTEAKREGDYRFK